MSCGLTRSDVIDFIEMYLEDNPDLYLQDVENTGDGEWSFPINDADGTTYTLTINGDTDGVITFTDNTLVIDKATLVGLIIADPGCLSALQAAIDTDTNTDAVSVMTRNATGTFTHDDGEGNLIVVPRSNSVSGPAPDSSVLVNNDYGLARVIDKARNVAAPIAELDASNAATDTVSYSSMRALFTNRAAEGGAQGMMNDDGSLGWYSKVIANVAAGGTIDIDSVNGGTVRLEGSADGDLFTIPPSDYVGQVIRVRGPFQEEVAFPGGVILRNTGGIIGGSARRTDGTIGDVPIGPLDNEIVIRANEIVELWGSSAGSWRVVNHNYDLYQQPGFFRENENGDITAYNEITLTAGTPIRTVAFPAGLVLTNNSYYVTTGKETTNPAAVDIGIDNKTTTGFDLIATGLSGTNPSVTVNWHLEGGMII